MPEGNQNGMIPVDQVRALVTEIVMETLGGKPGERLSFLEERLATLELRTLLPKRS